MWHVTGRGEVNTGFWWGSPNEIPLGRRRVRWEDNIKMNPQEIGRRLGLYRSDTGYGQIAGSCECGYELSGYIKCKSFSNSSVTTGFSRNTQLYRIS
jgi:hypothetical protein